MTTSAAPTTPSNPAPHKAAFGVAITALLSSGITLSSVVAFAHQAFPGATAYITAAVTTVGAFLARYLPYVARGVKAFFAARKAKKALIAQLLAGAEAAAKTPAATTTTTTETAPTTSTPAA